jgi:hypothetical protein
VAMFDKEYSFRGSHAEKAIKLTADFDGNRNKLFKRNLDVYIMAPIIGFLYQEKDELDKGSETTKIFPEQLINEQSTLQFNYRLIMLLDSKHEMSFDERVNKAFRYYGSEKARLDEVLYEQYVLGGVNILHRKLIESAKSEEDYLANLYDFIEEFDERYNQLVSTEDISNLCRLARS